MEEKLKENLKNECFAIGSLPYKSVDKAMNVVAKYCSEIPFCPQLPKLSRFEDMILQYTDNLPGKYVEKETGKVFLTQDTETFIDDLEKLFVTFEGLDDISDEDLDYYGITEEYSKTFRPYIELINKLQPNFAKTQVTGPFTLSSSLTDLSDKCACYDETLREVVTKTLSLKALWQIKEIKKVSPKTTPIIFIDEPSLSQLGTSAYLTISTEEIINTIKIVSDVIQKNGGLSAIHCCGKCNWSIAMDVGMNIINFDAYSFSENMSTFTENLKEFYERDGFIAWGIVPTLDSEALEKANKDILLNKLKKAQELLIKKGLDENSVINNSIITPSCGCGSLSEEMAEKALKLTSEISSTLKG